MNRVGIFCFYDKNGIADNYTEHLLKNMKIYLSKMIIVINGDIEDASCKLLDKYADFIIQRQNVGFDGGAYRDVFLNYLKSDDLINIDEIILFNSSFWGPVHSFDGLFMTMDKVVTDFWGLTKWIEGPSSMPRYPVLPEHIQGYFIGVRASLFHSQVYKDFWNQMETPRSYDEAIRNFEISFTQYFSQRGYKYTTFIDAHRGKEYLKQGEVVYTSHGGDLVAFCDFPIIKKKIVDFMAFNQISLLNKCLYDNDLFSELISSSVQKLEEDMIPYDNIQEFYDKHNRIYIYGHGKWGKCVESYFEYKGWNIEAFIVSKDANKNKKEINISDVKFEMQDGVIVAVGMKNWKQISSFLLKLVPQNNLLVPQYED